MNSKFFLYFGFGMAVLYFVSGILMIIYGEKVFDIPAWARVGTGSLLIVYGIFRFHRYRNMIGQNENH